MANIFLVSHILLLFHSPKGSWNKSAKYEKLGKYWSYCIRNRVITNTYCYVLVFLTHLFIIYLFAYLFTYLFIHSFIYFSTYWFFSHLFSLLFLTSIIPIYHFLPPFTIYFILFNMHLFRYLVMFLTCSYLYRYREKYLLSFTAIQHLSREKNNKFLSSSNH